MLYPHFLFIILGVIIVITILILNSIKISTKFECIKKGDSSDILILFYLFSGLFKQQYRIPITNILDLLKIIYELLLGEKGVLIYKKTDKLKKDNKGKKDNNN